MTIAGLQTARGVQVLGGLLAVAALVALAISPTCGSAGIGLAAAGAIGLDFLAILTRRGNVAIALSLLKLGVVFVGPTLLVSSCRPIVNAEPSLLPNGFSVTLLFASALASLLGAFMVRTPR